MEGWIKLDLTLFDPHFNNYSVAVKYLFLLDIRFVAEGAGYQLSYWLLSKKLANVLLELAATGRVNSAWASVSAIIISDA